MDRRDTLKTLLVGTVAGATVGVVGCKTPTGEDEKEVKEESIGLYGRTPKEIEWDNKVATSTFLSEQELETIAILCDIILPATETAGSATDAGVPEFIDFIVKDITSHQVPVRGGLMWLDTESNSRFNKVFKTCTNDEQIQIIDDIAYPDDDNKKPELSHGIKFFNHMRNLTLTGYYTTRMGLDDLEFDGNYANTWDGVPEEVLKDHDVDYDPEWIAKCVDQSKRLEIAQWDDDMNLVT